MHVPRIIAVESSSIVSADETGALGKKKKQNKINNNNNKTKENRNPFRKYHPEHTILLRTCRVTGPVRWPYACTCAHVRRYCVVSLQQLYGEKQHLQIINIYIYVVDQQQTSLGNYFGGYVCSPRALAPQGGGPEPRVPRASPPTSDVFEKNVRAAGVNTILCVFTRFSVNENPQQSCDMYIWRYVCGLTMYDIRKILFFVYCISNFETVGCNYV